MQLRFIFIIQLSSWREKNKKKVHVSPSLHPSTLVSDDCTHDTDALLWKTSVSDPLCVFCGLFMSPSLSVRRVLSDTRSVSPFSPTHAYRGNILYMLLSLNSERFVRELMIVPSEFPLACARYIWYDKTRVGNNACAWD